MAIISSACGPMPLLVDKMLHLQSNMRRSRTFTHVREDTKKLINTKRIPKLWRIRTVFASSLEIVRKMHHTKV